MNVELAEERILLLPDKLGAAQAEGRTWAKRTDAFGAFAKIGGFLNKPKDEDYEVVYRELRLQPFWRLSASTRQVYERQRQHKIKVGPEVQSFALGAETYPAINREVAITVTEACTESSQREWLFDGITKKAEPGLKSYLGVESKPVTPDDLNELQHLDMVLQHVSAVGEFLAVIASRPQDPEAIAAAIRGITLGDVRDRLSGANGAGRSNGGELDLLDREDAA